MSAQNGRVQSLDALRRVLVAQHEQGIAWRKIARSYPDVPAGTLCAISKGRDPRKPAIRAALRLPVTAAAPVCPVHGVVHTTKRCPPAPRPDYAAWRAANLPLLERMVAWAETPKEQRGEWER